MKKITIITPTYNRAKTLPKVFESLLNQSFKDFLWIILDDGSTDNTSTVVENFQLLNPFFEIIYKKDKNRHKFLTVLEGVKMVKTPYFMVVDSDDIYPEDALETLISEVEKIEIGTNGKIDKSNLRDNEESIKFNLGTLSEKEETIVSIFKDVLEVEYFDISKDFYSLGGDSLGFILLVSKIDEKFFQGKNKEFIKKMMDIYENATVFNIYGILKELN